MHVPLRRFTLSVATTVVGVASFLSCGDDKSSDPPTELQEVIDVPGDVPNLDQALERVADGDVIRLAPGRYERDSLVVKIAAADVSLIGRSSASGIRPVLVFDDKDNMGIRVDSLTTRFTIRGLAIEGEFRAGIRVEGPGSRVEDCRVDGGDRSSVWIRYGEPDIEVTSNLLIGARLFGVNCGERSTPRVSDNTIIRARDCGIIIQRKSNPVIRRNLVYDSTNWGIVCLIETDPEIECNDVFLAGAGLYGPACDGEIKDISADPLFCDEETWAIAADSPCAPGMNPCGGLIGAVGVGCSPGAVPR